MKRYLVVVEKEGGNYAAYSPDVPGCVATGDTVEETLELMQEALTIFLEETHHKGDELPVGHSVVATFVTVPEPQVRVTGIVPANGCCYKHGEVGRGRVSCGAVESGAVRSGEV